MKEESLKSSEKKWGVKQIESGFTLFPSILVTRQQALGIDAVEMNILLHLIVKWWSSDNYPFPSKKAIADSMGIDVSTVRRRIARMEADGLIKREARYVENAQTSNKYDLSPLVKALEKYAQEEIDNRKIKTEARVSKRTRKLPLTKHAIETTLQGQL